MCQREDSQLIQIPVSRFVSNSSPTMIVSHESELHEARSIYFYFISEFEIFVARLIRGCFVQLMQYISAQHNINNRKKVRRRSARVRATKLSFFQPRVSRYILYMSLPVPPLGRAAPWYSRSRGGKTVSCLRNCHREGRGGRLLLTSPSPTRMK